jgi:hypothetical protein
MINLFNRDKKVIWWSTVDQLENTVPILPLSRFYPDWFKSMKATLPDEFSRGGTVKDCPSFIDLFSNGFVVPLWTDVLLKVEDEKYEWHCPSKQFNFTSHGAQQFKHHLPEHVKDSVKLVFKPDCPWRLKTPPGYSTWQFPMFYHYNPVFEVLPGIIRTDVHHEINQQMIIKQDGEHKLARGTPLAIYVPFKREKLPYEIRNSNDKECIAWARKANLALNSKYKRSYLNIPKLYEEASKSKCPFL